MTAVYGILGLLSLGVPAAVGFLGLAIAMHVLFVATGLNPSPERMLSLAVVLLSVPLTALFAGMLFDSFVAERRIRVFSTLLPVLACAIMLQGDGWSEYVALALSESSSISSGKNILLFTSALSAAAFCGALSAFVVLMADLVFEMPVRWLEGALQARVDLALAASRSLIIVIGLALSVNLVTGLLSQELWPTTIVARFAGK